MNISATITKDIPFYDLDPMQVVWHGNYIKYMEDARCALLEKLSYTYDDMKTENIAYPVAKLEIKYIKPCRFAQKINIKAILNEYDPCLIISYEIYDANTNEKMLKAKTMQICIDIKTYTTIYTPSKKLLEGVKNYV